MKLTVYPWQDREFVALSGEGTEGDTATEQTTELLRRFDSELRRMGLSLDNTVRTRLWGVDRDSRDQGGSERVRVLSGKARSASSSYISKHHFDSEAKVAIDLFAMRPKSPATEKFLKEYDPPIIPLRYLTYDSMAVLSGVTAVLPTLADQLDDILPRVEGSLSDAGCSWDQVVHVAFFLHRSQKLEELRRLFSARVSAQIPEIECSFVNGYSTPGKHIEVEVTAKLPTP
jgi:enamine deaminase RidA (YjgF/YER057c/UK114 family)